MLGTNIIGKPRDVRLHVRRGIGDTEELIVTLLETDRGIGTSTVWQVNLNGAADHLGYLERDPDHLTYQVHDRIRYDNKRRVAWRSWRRNETTRGGMSGPRVSGLWEETRVDALAYLLDVGRSDVHLPGRVPMWIRCSLCNERNDT